MTLVQIGSGSITVVVAAHAGGRIASIAVEDTEILVTAQDAGVDPDDLTDAVAMMQWGSFPMAPWAGRVRRGHFTHDGVEHTLPVDLAPHAIHGSVYRRPWTVGSNDATTLTLHTDLDWPLGGWATQRISVDGSVVQCTLEVTAGDRSMPAQVGWHPWFRKPTTTRLRFAAMYERDSDGIPTGALVDPGAAGTLDDCLVDPLSTPSLVIPGRRGSRAVEVDLESDCRHWVVYDRPDHATCVEPQSGPPNGFTLEPTVVAPGATLRRRLDMKLRTVTD
jgi:aldose 1-epimerase